MPFALITGGSKGIGKAIAEILAGRGYDLLLVARSADALEQVSSEIHSLPKETAVGSLSTWLKKSQLKKSLNGSMKINLKFQFL